MIPLCGNPQNERGKYNISMKAGSYKGNKRVSAQIEKELQMAVAEIVIELVLLVDRISPISVSADENPKTFHLYKR